jgi:inosine-uridine nucleoside N-ribohydrolase
VTIPLLLDTDIGDDVDDVFALLLAAKDPAVSLQVVTTVFGDAEERARIARKILDLAGRTDVPVAAGYRQTLDGRDPTGGGGATMTSARGFVGARGTAEWDALGERLRSEHAVDAIVDFVARSATPPVLAAVGPLTNLAEAIRRAPELALRVHAIVLMGGRLGEDAARGEHNFNMDPEATRIVLESGAPLKIGTWDVTSQAQLGEQHLARLRAAGPAGSAAASQLETYLRHRKRPWTSMYDPISLTMAYTDRYLQTKPMALRLTTGPRLAVLSVDPDAPATAEVSVGLDAPAYVEHQLRLIEA